MIDEREYEAAKLAAIRESKERLTESDREAGGYGAGFIHGFRAAWEASHSDS